MFLTRHICLHSCDLFPVCECVCFCVCLYLLIGVYLSLSLFRLCDCQRVRFFLPSLKSAFSSRLSIIVIQFFFVCVCLLLFNCPHSVLFLSFPAFRFALLSLLKGLLPQLNLLSVLSLSFFSYHLAAVFSFLLGLLSSFFPFSLSFAQVKVSQVLSRLSPFATESPFTHFLLSFPTLSLLLSSTKTKPVPSCRRRALLSLPRLFFVDTGSYLQP